MNDCVYSFLFLCWAEAWKFYVWLVVMTITWSVVIAVVVSNLLRRRK